MSLASFLDRFTTPTNGIGRMGQSLVAAAGGPIGNAMALMMHDRNQREENDAQNQLRAAQLEEVRRRMAMPRIEHAGNDIVMLDPATGAERGRIHGTAAPSEFERALTAAGIDPASDEGRRLSRSRALNMADPQQAIPGFDENGNRTITFYRRGELDGTQPQPEAAPPATPGGPPRRRVTAESLNNPGGLRIPGTSRYQSFPSVAAGVEAQESLLRRRYLANGNTIRGVVERYAPRRRNGGDNTDEQIDNYIAYVARQMGMTPDQPIDASFTAPLARAMRGFETGRREPPPSRAAGGLPQVRTADDYNRLPRGAEYTDPQGRRRRKS